MIALRSEAVALWLDATDQLSTAQSQGDAWSDATLLSTSAVAFDAERNISDTLGLAYIKPISSADEPAGIYYRTNTGTSWSNAVLVHSSLYFRTATAQDLQISVAGVNQNVLIAWDDPQLNQSQYARSGDGGRTWSEPQIITGTESGRTRRVHVAAAPNGDLLLIWQDTSLSGCGWTQRRSSDGGNTWSDAQRVLGSMTRCEERFAFSIADNRLWLASRATTDSVNTTVTTAIMAAWDGRTWSPPSDVSLSFVDAATNRTLTLNCLNVDIAGQTASVIGCDPIGDVWGAHNAIALTDLGTALTSVWSPVEVISDRTAPAASEGIVATTADRQGHIYALWSQAIPGDSASTALYGSELIDKHWARATLLLGGSGVSNNDIGHAGQPALMADNRDRIHAVWSSGTTGAIYYAWAYARDFNSATSWSQPVIVPQTAPTTGWPNVTVGPDSDTVYVIYAAPFNEKRGIYFNRSDDNGTTWWLTPTLVFDAAAAQWDSADKPRLVFDPSANVLHAIWLRANLPNSLSPRSVYYARSTDGGQTWSQPLTLTVGQVDWPRLALNGPGELVAAWTERTTPDQAEAITPLGVVSVASNDGGLHWTAPDQVHGLEHISGPIDIAPDRSGKLYLGAIGQTLNGESALIYAEWAAQKWGQAQSVTLSQDAVMGNSTALTLAPETGQLVVLMRLWVFDQQNHGSFQIAAMNREVQVTSITPVPAVTPVLTATPAPTVTPLPTTTPLPPLPDNTQLPKTVRPETNPLILGSLLAAIIVVVVVARTIWIRRRRN